MIKIIWRPNKEQVKQNQNRLTNKNKKQFKRRKVNL